MECSTLNLRLVGWRTSAAVVVPFVVLSAYLLFSRWPSRWFTTFSDYAGMGVSVLIGSALIATLPISREVRVLLLVFYIPGFCFLLFLFSLQFLGMVFGDWL